MNKVKESKCIGGCCRMFVTDYKDIIYSLDDDWKESTGHIKKAGCFIYDPTSKKVLIVQSRAFKWGSPKGSVQENERPVDCAIREVKEETGLTISESMFIQSWIVSDNNLYFLIHLPEVDIKDQYQHIQSIAEDALLVDKERNDVNGMGWIKIECLREMMIHRRILINQNTKQLLRKFLDVRNI